MTNAEFYAEEIKIFEDYKDKDFCNDFIKPRVFEGGECGKINCIRCNALVALWLQEEHKDSEIDWENVPVDTPILVREDETEEWTKRYFAKTVGGDVYAWDEGTTSFTSYNDLHYRTSRWKYAKLWEGSEEQAAEKEAQCTD